MDFIKDQVSKYGGQSSNKDNNNPPSNPSDSANQSSDSNNGGGGGFLSSITNKMNTAAGGGVESEKNEDYLDKGIDYVQEKFMGQGPQNDESAVEQAKDEQISDFIRGKYKSTTGSDMPIQDKKTTWD